jgi:membrane protein implicated in regulation of membrane protease activity
MSAWVVWLIAAGALAVGEMLTLALVLGLTAGGALVASGVAATGAGAAWQALAFGLVSAALLVGLRPVARRHLLPTPTATGIDALLGASGTVVAPIDGGAGGRVRIKGEVWSARAFPDDQALPVGTPVRVLRIDGATAVVHSTEVTS